LILGDKITLIDTGVKGSEKIIFDYLQKQNRNPSEIDIIILSHSHPDHIGSAARIKELTNCKVFAHELEKEWIENIDLQCKQRPVPGFYNLVDKPVVIDKFISDNETMIVQKGITLIFFKASGHSKGSLNVLFEEDKILFTADSIPLKNDIPNYDNYKELMKSLEIIKKYSDSKILLTSWTPPLTDKNEIEQIIREGEEYMKRINSIVTDCYKDKNTSTLDFCKIAIDKLGLPPFLVNPIVDKAFKSHLS
jgi:glyoxylase-like metal-dependent hydrolase (beta-lactamase superfamily II)